MQKRYRSNRAKFSYQNSRHKQLDFSFFKLESLDELPQQNARNTKEKSTNKKCMCDIVKLNNNLISNIDNIHKILSAVIIDTAAITWIDLSSNQITSFADEFGSFPKLQILHLQGNKISNMENIEKLADCPYLIKLALHGNPIESSKNYRPWIISLLPGLKNFDMSPVTRRDLYSALEFFPNQKIRDRIDALRHVC